MYVCICKGVTGDDFLRALCSGGLTTAELVELFEWDSPGVCGLCRAEAPRLVDLALRSAARPRDEAAQ